MPILVLTTGGTIGAAAHNKLRNPDRVQKMPPDGRDTVREALQTSFADIDARYVKCEHRDSNHIDEAYRRDLMAQVAVAPESDILITHGTDTLLNTAEYAEREQQANPALQDKVILLTGALIPLANGHESDGYMNLDFALHVLTAGNLVPGVYIVLCDYQDAENKTGWEPRLYPFEVGSFEKYYDPDDARRSRLMVKQSA
jgi:L-asparaginase